MKKVAGSLRLDLAYFNELQAFAQFASDLDAATKAQLNRGERLVELLKQPQYQPIPVEEQGVLTWAGTNRHLDDIPVAAVQRFAKELIAFLHNRRPEIIGAIKETGDLNDATIEALANAIREFKAEFKA